MELRRWHASSLEDDPWLRKPVPKDVRLHAGPDEEIEIVEEDDGTLTVRHQGMSGQMVVVPVMGNVFRIMVLEERI